MFILINFVNFNQDTEIISEIANRSFVCYGILWNRKTFRLSAGLLVNQY